MPWTSAFGKPEKKPKRRRKKPKGEKKSEKKISVASRIGPSLPSPITIACARENSFYLLPLLLPLLHLLYYTVMSMNLGADLVLGDVEEKRSSILYFTIRGRRKDWSELADISNSAMENRNSEKGVSNAGAQQARTKEAQATKMRAVEETKIQEKTRAEKEIKRDSGWLIGVKLLYV